MNNRPQAILLKSGNKRNEYKERRREAIHFCVCVFCACLCFVFVFVFVLFLLHIFFIILKTVLFIAYIFRHTKTVLFRLLKVLEFEFIFKKTNHFYFCCWFQPFTFFFIFSCFFIFESERCVCVCVCVYMLRHSFGEKRKKERNHLFGSS